MPFEEFIDQAWSDHAADPAGVVAGLDLVTANDGPALERLFAWQVLGRVGRAAGDRVGQERALQQARAALGQVDPVDRVGCAAEIDQLDA